MLAWLTQSSSAGEKGVSRQRERDAPGVGDGKEVIYASKNKKKGISFVCSAPVGSPHAAEAMEICGQIYKGTATAHDKTSQDKTPRALKDRHERDELSRHEEPQSTNPRRHSRLEAAQTSPFKRHRGLGSDRASVSTFDEDDDNSDRASTCALSAISSVSTITSLTSASRHARQADVDPPRGRYSARGFRHADDSKTTYFVEKEGRTMFVSAPKGTTEAAVFDAIAQKGVATGTTKIEVSNGESRHRFVGRG